LQLGPHAALVTGASGHIGSEIARCLAQAGATVLVHYRANERRAKQTVQQIQEAGGSASALQADLCDESAARGLFSSIAEAGHPLRYVVNNAAEQPVTELASLSGQEWQQVMAANLNSAFHVTQAAFRHMVDEKSATEGAIVNIASIEGSDPAAGHAHYAASKAALLMLTKASAMEYGKHGVRINAVSPGLVNRPSLAKDWPDGVQRWQANAPLQRLGEASDVANAVLFLLSPAARWISGTNLVVDGGMSCVSRW